MNVHPITILELSLLSLPVLGIFLLSQFFRGKNKNVLKSLSLYLLVTVLFGYFIARPMWIDYRASLFEDKINQYLLETHGNDSWKIVHPHRNNPSRSIYHFDVYFAKQPDFVYMYYVNKSGNVIQTGFGTHNFDGNELDNAKYLELNNK